MANPLGRTPPPVPGQGPQGPQKKEPEKEEVKGVKSLRERLAGAIPMGAPGKPLTNVKQGMPEKKQTSEEEEPPPPSRAAPGLPPRRAQMPLPLSTAPTDLPPPMPIGAPPTRGLPAAPGLGAPPARGLPAAPGEKPDKPMAEPRKQVTPQRTGMGDFNAALKSNPIFAKQQAMEKVGKEAKAFGFEYNNETKMFVNKQGEGYSLDELKTKLSSNKDAQINNDFQLAMKMAQEFEAEDAKAASAQPQEVKLSNDETNWAQDRGYMPVFGDRMVILGYEEPETNAFISNADIKEAYNFEQLAATKGFKNIAPGIFENDQGDIVTAEELKDIIQNS